MYQKEIIYIGLYKDGSRIGNAGFLKIENKGQGSRLDLRIRNIPFNIKGRFPIRIHSGSGWKEINGISVQDGSGSWEDSMPNTVQNMQIQITLPGGYFLDGKSKNGTIDSAQEREKAGEYTDKSAGGMTETLSDRQENRTTNILSDRQMNMHNGMQDVRPVEAKPEMTHEIRENATAEAEFDKQEGTDTPQTPKTVIITEELQNFTTKVKADQDNFASEPVTARSLKEDKWEQILDSYEKIHPYGDERVYVKLEPKDFIILQSRYQHLVNNSFLLHGFYNYRYLILGKEEDYYLGVPGVFYEREKMVALMFGFEAFECPGGVAKAGEFGYYLRKVEL